jgi:hypothetical protein
MPATAKGILMTMTTDPPTTTGPGEPRRPNRGRVITGAAAATVGVAALAWAVGHGHPDAAPAAAAYESACGLRDGPTDRPTGSLDVQWQNMDGSWQPVSATEGPGLRNPTGAWSCYAHTPTGAVLAAYNIQARITVAADFPGVVKQQTRPGTGQTALLKLGQQRTPASDQVSPAGFTINAYDPSAATVTFYLRQPGRGFTGRCSASVQWVGGRTGDWQLLLSPDGASVSNCEQAQIPADGTASGFVAWGPNS